MQTAGQHCWCIRVVSLKCGNSCTLSAYTPIISPHTSMRVPLCFSYRNWEIYTFLSFDVGIRQKICSRILRSIAWRGCIKASTRRNKSFLVAFVHGTSDDTFCSLPPSLSISPQLCVILLVVIMCLVRECILLGYLRRKLGCTNIPRMRVRTVVPASAWETRLYLEPW